MTLCRDKRSFRTFGWGVRGFAIVALIWMGFWSVPANADPASEKKVVDVGAMSVKDRAELGEKLIFGRVGGSEGRGDVGKALCPLCHTFQKGFGSDRAPNLFGITERAKERLNDPRYHLGKPNERDTVQKEAFPGSGTASTALEYIAESSVCPNCYVVKGFGLKGSKDRENTGEPDINVPAFLSIDELIAIDTWLYVHDGKKPPSPQEIEQAYAKFIPQSKWPKASRHPEIYPARFGLPPLLPDGTFNLSGKEPIEEIFNQAACTHCHIIPGIQGVDPSMVAPKLNMRTTAPERMKSSEYRGKATHIREYIIESIVDPSIYVVKGYPDNLMPKNYNIMLTGTVIDKMADYLSQLEDGVESPKVP